MKDLIKSPIMWLIAIIIIGAIWISSDQQKTNRYPVCYDRLLLKQFIIFGK